MKQKRDSSHVNNASRERFHALEEQFIHTFGETKTHDSERLGQLLEALAHFARTGQLLTTKEH